MAKQGTATGTGQTLDANRLEFTDSTQLLDGGLPDAQSNVADKEKIRILSVLWSIQLLTRYERSCGIAVCGHSNDNAANTNKSVACSMMWINTTLGMDSIKKQRLQLPRSL